MISQVLKATCDNSVKNDFVFTCKKYLETLKINVSFDEIEKMSSYTFKKLLKEKTRSAAFEYLEGQKNKQDKIKEIVHTKLEMQEYLADGDRNTSVAKIIYKARGKTLDVKLQKSWKYSDKLCSGCKTNEESGDEILSCDSFGDNPEKLPYSWFYSSVVTDQVSVGKIMLKKMKAKDKINEGIT
jgi:hypothetical protein